MSDTSRSPDGSGRTGVEERENPTPKFDLKDALERVGGDRALLVELADILRAEVPRLLADIQSALRHGDLHIVGGAAHRLRGSAGSFGARATADAAGLLELTARSGDLSQSASRYDDLERVARRLLDDLSAVLS